MLYGVHQFLLWEDLANPAGYVYAHRKAINAEWRRKVTRWPK